MQDMTDDEIERLIDGWKRERGTVAAVECATAIAIATELLARRRAMRGLSQTAVAP